MVSQKRFELGRELLVAREGRELAVATAQRGLICIAQPRGGLHQRIEHRLQIESRATYDLEHVAGRGLVFERFFEIAVAFAQFAEQPRVLHRNHRLRREVLQQGNFFFGKQPNLLALGNNLSKQTIVVAQWHKQNRADAGEFERGTYDRIGNLRRVRYLHNASSAQQLTERVRSAGSKSLPQAIGKARCETSRRYRTIFLAIIDIQTPERGAAEPVCLFQNRIEHRREVAGRRVDDLQDLRGRRLLLQGLSRLGDQPRILDRDHRLRREILQQRDLLVGEWPHFLAKCGDRAEHYVIFSKRHRQQCADTAGPDDAFQGVAVAVVGADVGEVDAPLALHDPRRCAPLGRPGPKLPPGFDEARIPVGRCSAESFSLADQQPAVRGSAEGVRLLQYRVEHRGEIAGRAVDDMQYLGGGGLLVQRLARLGDQPRVLHRDHRLCREVLQQCDLPVGERPDLLAIDVNKSLYRVVSEERYG